MTTPMTPEFKNAKLYTCRDGEYITQTDWEEAIRDVLESDWEDGETVAEQCERTGVITVQAYADTPISPSWIDGQVDLFMERFRDNFSEEYGCDDHDAEPWTDETQDWAKKVLVANLTKSLRSAQTHACEQIGSHTFSVEECIEMMK